MPNWRGVNSKALEAQAAKKASKEAKLKKEREEFEAKQWEDDVTEQALKKRRRIQEELLKKKQEKSARKAELRKLAQEEDQAIMSKKPSETKLTRAQIQQQLLAASIRESKKKLNAEENSNQSLLIENVNLLRVEERRKALEQNQDIIIAGGIDEYFAQVEETSIDRAPERRMKAQFAAYQEEWLPKLKKELKDRLWKQWQKASENPLNQAAQTKSNI